ncbi:hypothetical protein BH11VER1_BH11VER1_33160 [soil metagenome]
MITKFPSPQRQLKPLKVELSLHQDADREMAEENREWVRWIFQSIRVRCLGMAFHSEATERSALIEDWMKFIEQSWLPILAPALLQGWQEAVKGDQAALLRLNVALSQQLSDDARTRSLEAGAILMKQTSGARYQGVLGRFRQIHLEEAAEVHAVMVWSCIAVLFQLPLPDVLNEYLREEWLAGSQSCHHRDEPHGQLSFGALTHRVMREGGMVEFEIKVEAN